MDSSLQVNIRSMREKQRLTQEQLAKKINRNTMTVRRFENGSRIPRANDLVNIAAVLGCKVSDLLDCAPTDRPT